MKQLNDSLAEEFGAIFGEDCASALITEKRKKGIDQKKILQDIRILLTEAGGERYANIILQSLNLHSGDENHG